MQTLECIKERRSLSSPFWPWYLHYHPQPICQGSFQQNHLPVERQSHHKQAGQKTENKSLVSNGEYHGDTFFSMCLLQFLLLRLLLILLAHHRRWDWLYKWVPLQQTLMVKNLLSLLLNLPFGRNIWEQ